MYSCMVNKYAMVLYCRFFVVSGQRSLQSSKCIQVNKYFIIFIVLIMLYFFKFSRYLRSTLSAILFILFYFTLSYLFITFTGQTKKI